MKVLIGIDGSPRSMEAVRQAGKFLTVHDSIALYYAYARFIAPPGSNIDPKVVMRAQQILADSVFREAVSQLPDALRTHVEQMPGTQDPRHGLLVAAEEWRADLIVVGARGLNMIQRWLMGSVSTSIVQHSRVPVLVARDRNCIDPNDWSVLVANDGSPACRQAAKLLNQLSWPKGAAGHVMTVIEPPLGLDLPEWLEDSARQSGSEPLARAWVRHHEAERVGKAQELARWRDDLPAPFRDTTPIVCDGNPADQILNQASSLNVDLVVLGARRLGIMQRMLGSTSQKVLHHAACSVLIVRESEHA